MSARRLKKALGLTDQEAQRLLRRARNRLGSRSVAVKGLAFTLAVNPLLGRLLPRQLRETAIRPLMYALIPGPSENLLYARVTLLDKVADREGIEG